ncbi:NADP-dependent oxidoreductase domain-containing protein [Cadophora sp. MPI-SDFR-AT-0126]|nr:NADP-dependent oxidoreductase domain-containing protein [Leotiomycetes sp. MPI-SDFR-AT-0126]
MAFELARVPCSTTPPVGLGTFRLKHDAVKPVVRDAIRLGYRHIDTAAIYRNEVEIGEVLQELYASDTNTVSRPDLWITSKLSPYDMATPRKALLKTLSALQTSYLDLYLIHWPAMARKPASSPDNKRLRLEAWKVLNEAKKEGLVRHIGVSNFTVEHLRELSETEWGIKKAFVQMEIHPWYWKDAAEIQKVFEEHSLNMVGYALLAEGKLVADDSPRVIDQIAQRSGVTKVQLVLAWALKKNWLVLVKSENESHLLQNLESPTLVGALTADDIRALDEISAQGEEKRCWDPRLVK